MSARRIALLTPAYWPEVRRGGERIVHDLAGGLLARGHRPRIVTSQPRRGSRGSEDGVEVVRRRRPPEGVLRRWNTLEYLSHLPGAYAALRREDDDAALALYAADGLAAARWARVTGRPYVLAYMGIPDRPGLTDRVGRLEVTRRAAEEADAVTTLSRAAAEAFARWLGVEARVIAPPVDVDTFAPGDERAEPPTIVCPAALDDPRKRVALLVEAFRTVRLARPQARLVLVRPRSAAAPDPLALPGVELVDDRGDRALAGVYRRAWVTALPSLGEAFGLVLAESLACGTPVVGTDHGAIPEIVDRDTIGRLFAGDDPAQLARALLEALDLAADPATAPACRERALEFSTDRCAQAYETLLDELLP